MLGKLRNIAPQQTCSTYPCGVHLSNVPLYTIPIGLMHQIKTVYFRLFRYMISSMLAVFRFPFFISPHAHARRVKQLVLSVCQFVSLSVRLKFINLNIDRVKQFPN